MSQGSLSSAWLNKFSDPYAVLGIAVTADDSRVQKRNRKVVMSLHPDRHVSSDEETRQFTEQLLARLVNPAYEQLGQEKSRKETIALLRVRVRQQTRQGALTLHSELARQLIQQPVGGVDVFYEQAITQLAEVQYQPLTQAQFELVTQQLGELNLAYLQLKMGNVVPPREQRTGLVASEEAKPIQVTPVPINSDAAQDSYSERHYKRAYTYMKQGNFSEAEKELRDAIKLDPTQSKHYALLGAAYFHLNKQGLAKVYIGQSLKLSSDDSIANRYAAKLGIEGAASSKTPSGKESRSRKGEPSGKQPSSSRQSNAQTFSSTNGQSVNGQTAGRRSSSSHQNQSDKNEGFAGFLRSLFNVFR